MLINKQFAMLTGLVAIILTSACSHVSIPVQVTRPAQINLSAYKNIAVGPFQGKEDEPSTVFELLVTAVQALGEAASANQAFQTNWQGSSEDGSDVALHVFNALSSNGRFSMIDFSGIPNAQASGNAVLLVSGTVADKSFTSKLSAEKLKNSEGVAYTTFTQSWRVTYNVNVKLVDVSNGAIYLSKRYPCQKTGSMSQNDQKPSKLGSYQINELYDDCKRDIAGQFAKAVAPYTETVHAHFAKIDNSPSTEAGIHHARAGNWDAAIASFEKVPATQSMAEPQVQAKSWWNLGLAYEYDYQFSKALEMVQKAYSLYPESRYLNEESNIEMLQKNQAKLKQQEYQGDKPTLPSGS